MCVPSPLLEIAPDSMPHSSFPLLIRKYPFSPQNGFQLFATFQYFTPFSTPHPTILLHYIGQKNMKRNRLYIRSSKSIPNSMTSFHFSMGVTIDTTSIIFKITVYIECSGDGTVFHDFLLKSFFIFKRSKRSFE